MENTNGTDIIIKMEAMERLYGHGVVTCEWNGGDKGESGWYFEDILEIYIPPNWCYCMSSCN